MSNHKANLCIAVLIVLTACTKENTPISGTADANAANSLLWRWPLPNQQPDPDPNPDSGSNQETEFGLLEAGVSYNQTLNDMNEANVDLVRVAISLSQTTVNRTIDDYLADGYNVQISANWSDATNGTRDFPTNMELLKTQAEAFFEYYAPYKSQIPFVAIENEWDWQVTHGANIKDYLTELSVITTIGHEYGFKIADGGITSTALQRWMYSQLSGDEQAEWKDDYYVGLNYNYDDILNMVNTYIAGVQDINIDYSNVHWYNARNCSYGFAAASQTFMEACNKKLVACNEFGIKTNSLDLYDATVDEIRGNTAYAIAYSGGFNDNAIKLTDAMLGLLD